MKFSYIATTLATTSLVAADQINLIVRVNNGQALGRLYSKHEGSGWNGFFIAKGTNSPQTFDYDPNTQLISWQLSTYNANFGSNGDFLATGPYVKPVPLTFGNNGVITNWNFWSCSNVGDLYNYSATEKIIAITAPGNSTAPFPQCDQVWIGKVVPASAFSTSTPALAVNNSTSTTTTIGCASCSTSSNTITTTTIGCVGCSTSSSANAITVSAGAAKNAMGAVAGVAGIAALLI